VKEDPDQSISDALQRCRNAKMGPLAIERTYLPVLARVVSEASARSMSCTEIAEAARGLGGWPFPDTCRRFEDEVLCPKGSKPPRLMYQIRRRRKHVFRLQNMTRIALEVLNMASTHVLFYEARDLLNTLLQELDSLELLLALNVYLERQRERALERARIRRQADAGITTRPKTLLDLQGDAEDWATAVWPRIINMMLHRGLLNTSPSRRTEKVSFDTSLASGADATRILSQHWPLDKKTPSKHYSSPDGLSYRLTIEEEERQERYVIDHVRPSTVCCTCTLHPKLEKL